MAEEQEEPTLPEYPSVDRYDDEYSQARPLSKRKRSYASHMFSDSSEPAIFSSDNDPAAENYIQGPRQKKQYRGTWDDQQPIDGTPEESSAARGKRKFERQVDSGVFMGSDDWDPDFPPPPAASRMPQFNTIASQRAPLDPVESLALQIIRRCVDGGQMSVDLSSVQSRYISSSSRILLTWFRGLNLQEISNDTIRLLGDVAPIPQVSKNVPFTQSEPELSILLSNNQLTRCPGAMFDLHNLTVLSLRGNRLTEIPPAISHLTNLKQLNVSLNALTSLPMELLELLYNTDSKLSTLFIHPNPFHQPDRHVDLPGKMDHLPHEGESGRNWLWKPVGADGFHANLVARTPVHYLGWKSSHAEGRHFGSFSQFRIPSDTQSQLKTEDFDAEPVLPAPVTTAANWTAAPAAPTKVFSLFELCLQTIPLKYPANTDWAEHTSCLPLRKATAGFQPEDDHLVKILQDVDAQYEAGFKRCTVCKRQVVHPAAQWIEWWDIFHVQTAPLTQIRIVRPLYCNSEERLVPFLRQACTWACVTDPVRGLARHPSVPAGEGGHSQ